MRALEPLEREPTVTPWGQLPVISQVLMVLDVSSIADRRRAVSSNLRDAIECLSRRPGPSFASFHSLR